MRYYTNECVRCGLPCVYEACPYYNVEHFQCDECGEETKLYHSDNGMELCAECILKGYTVVDGSDTYY